MQTRAQIEAQKTAAAYGAHDALTHFDIQLHLRAVYSLRIVEMMMDGNLNDLPLTTDA